MDFVLYKYSCPRWYGLHSGIKNIAISKTKDSDLIKNLESIENIASGSGACKIDLLQKYELTIKNVKNYAGITTIPVSVINNPIIGANDNSE